MTTGVAPRAESSDPPTFAVSVVVAAGDAESLGRTLDSLLAQTMTQWRAVAAVSDASSAAATVVERYAARDARIEPGLPSSLPWSLALHAGDVLHPTMLERARDAFAADAALDAVHCAWTITDERSRVLAERSCDATGDLFDLFARRAAFPTSVCVVRRAVLEAAGGFLPSDDGVAEWMLWQRVARRGARFGRVAETLVDRPPPMRRTASDVIASLDAGLRVIALGHGIDREVGLETDQPYYAGRLASADAAVFALVCRTAGELLGVDEDAALLVDRLSPRQLDDAVDAAREIMGCAALAARRTRAEWGELWVELRPRLERFLAAVQVRLQRPGLARAMIAEIQRVVLPYLPSELPHAVAGSHIVRVEVTQAIGDIELPPDAVRLQLLVVLEGTTLGALELAVAGGRVSSSAIKQAIADAHAWRILGRFFERTLGDESGGEQHAIGRGTLADQLWERDPPVVARAMRIIDRIASAIRGDDDGRRRGMPRPRIVEAGGRVPWLTFGARNVAAQLRVAGEPVASTEIVVGKAGVLTASALRAAVVDAAGDALAHVVVRDLLLGAPFQRGVTLRGLIRSGNERGAAP